MSKKEKIILASLLILGAILRFYNLESRLSFDWDQENFAWQAKSMVVDHKMTLIGAPTSVGGIHLGPFYTYLSNLFYLIFRMDPVGAGILSILFGIVTIFAFYFIGERLFDKKTGFSAAFLYAVSFPLITWDLVAWNPAPFPLFVLLTIFVLYQTFKEEKYLIVLLALLGIGLHFHFSALVLYLLSLVILLFFRPKFSRKTIFLSLSAFLLTISPLIFFDLRHNFHNSRQLINFFLFQSGSFPPAEVKFLPIGRMIWRDIFDFFLYVWPEALAEIFLIVIWLSLPFIWLVKKNKRKILIIFFLTFFLTFVSYSLYPGHVTEYYLMPLVSIAVLLTAYSLSSLFTYPKLLTIVASLFLLVFLALNLNLWWSYEKPMSLADKKEAVRFIVDDAKGKPFRISLTCAPGYDTGYRYLFWYYQANISTNLKDKIYTIVAPAGFDGIRSMKEFHGIGVLWAEGQK